MINTRILFGVVEGTAPKEMRAAKIKLDCKFCGKFMIFDIKIDRKITRKAR